MLISMGYLNQILPVSSMVEAAEVTRRPSMLVLVCQKHYLPMQLAHVFTVFEKLVACTSVPYVYFSCTHMYDIIMYTHKLMGLNVTY